MLWRKGMNRGIFGMTSEKRSEIHALVELLESKNPTPEPTDKLQDKVLLHTCHFPPMRLCYY
jgi:hypothetical protein